MSNAEGWLRYRGLTLYHGPVEQAWVESALGRAPATVIEVGSWDGGDTVRYGQWWPASRRIAIEADPERFWFVDLACKLSGAEAVHAAIGAVDGTVDFYRCLDDDGYGPAGSLYRRSRASREVTPQIRFTDAPITVPAKRLRTLCAELGIWAAPDFLHVDVEGAELDVLLGLDEFRPGVVLLEKGVDAWAHEGAASYERLISPFMQLLGYDRAVIDEHDDLWSLNMTQPSAWFKRAQAYEAMWALKWLAGQQTADPIDLKAEFCGGSDAEWQALMEHVKDKHVFEVGCGPSPQVLAWPAASITLIEPLWDILSQSGRLPSLPPNATMISQPAEAVLDSYVGKIDGAIVCRNCIDHAETPLGLLEAVLRTAASGCYVLFWSAFKHLAPDEGHHSYADNEEDVRNVFRASGFEIIRDVHCCPASHTEDWGALARKR